MRVLIAMLTALFAVLGSGVAGAQQPVKIRLSFVVPVSNWATLLMQKQDLARHAGKSYTLEIMHFPGTPQLITALNVGELEIANMGFTTLPIAVANAGLTDLRIIADELTDGVPGYYSNEFFVRKDGPIKTAADLKGKVLATNAFGSGTDVPLRVFLAKHGLQDKRDVTIIEAPIPAQPAMLAEQKVELIVQPRPFTANPAVRAQVRTLTTTAEVVGVNQLAMWVARAGFIEKNRAAMIDFMEDVLRIQRWYTDPANQPAAVKIAAALTKTAETPWQSWLFRKDGQNGDYYHSPDGKIDLDALQKVTDLQVQHGLIRQGLDVRKHADFSLVEEAAKRLR